MPLNQICKHFKPSTRAKEWNKEGQLEYGSGKEHIASSGETVHEGI